MDFTQFLPYDVLAQIFSARTFSNKDCLEFSKVCRSWREGVPGYTRTLWQRVHFYSGEWDTTDKHVTCFLGAHVREVLIDSFTTESHTVLDVLDMLSQAECLCIEKIAFRSCDFSMNYYLISYLRQFVGSTLTGLALIDHMANIPIIETIAAFPRLTQFYYSVTPAKDEHIYTSIAGAASAVKEADKFQCEMFSNMTCLSLLVPLSYPWKLQPLLERCPNLHSLRVGDTNIKAPQANPECDFSDVFRLCPRLVSISCNNGSNDSLQQTQWWRADDSIQSQCLSSHGLQEFEYYEGYHVEESYSALDNIVNCQKTLRALRICTNEESYGIMWTQLEKLHFPRLRSLRLQDIYIKEKSLTTLVAHCPGLEKVYLNTYPLYEYYQPVFDALCQRSNLIDLTVDYKFAGDPLNGGGWDLLALAAFRIFVPLCHFLESTTNKNLQRLTAYFRHMMNVVPVRLFTAVASTTSLKAFALCNQVEPFHILEYRVRQKNIVAFMHKLTKIESLTFEQVDFFGSAVFDAMLGLKHLSELVLRNCISFTAHDILSLLKKHRSLRRIVIDDQKAAIWTQASEFIDLINSIHSQCPYLATEEIPNCVVIEYSQSKIYRIV